jgi:hypothetical protein
MRYQYVIAVAILATNLSLGCGVKPNPNVCCATEAQCEKVGAHELRSCEVGQACSDGTCVASQCNVSTDCPAENPICMDNLCIGSCSTDAQCADTDRPFCDAGVCVGCRSPLDCSGNTTICDQEEHVCRGCITDNECASGVCIEFEATCATVDQLVYVDGFYGADAGTCTASQPCQSLAYALQHVTSDRNVVRVLGSGSGSSSTLVIPYAVIFDGTGTTMGGPANGPLFQVETAVLTIEGFTIAGASGQTLVSVANGGTVRMTNTKMNGAAISATGATLELNNMQFESSTLSQQPLVNCTNGTASVSASELRSASLSSTNCLLSLQRNKFYGTDGDLISVSGGKIVVENNLVVQSQQIADTAHLTGTIAGSLVRFNTFVNTSGVDSDGLAIYCDGTQDISNNIFAYRSRHPFGNGGFICPVHHSLFDSVAGPEQRAGQGNQATELPLIFADLNAQDFHLATTSPAKGLAQPNVLNGDLEGNPRPMPAGTNPDVGCYEGP